MQTIPLQVGIALSGFFDFASFFAAALTYACAVSGEKQLGENYWKSLKDKGVEMNSGLGLSFTRSKNQSVRPLKKCK